MGVRKIGIVGYYGFGNYGDELFLDAYRKYFPDCDLTILWNSDAGPNPTYPGNMSEIENLDCIIIGGGDLFIPKYFAATYFDPRFLAKPVYFYGAGVPLWIGEDENVIAAMNNFVQHENVRSISVRDVESADWINKRLTPRALPTYCADMVFTLDLPAVARDPKQKVFGLVMRKQMPKEIHWQNVEALLERARGFGYQIHNIVLATGSTRDDDLFGLQEFSYPHMTTIDPNDLGELTKAIGACDVIASTKFHGCVVAAAYSIPAITLTKTDKFINLYKDIERQDLLGHYFHVDLPDRLPKYIAPIPKRTIEWLKSDAHRGMLELRQAIMRDLG